ncbi:MAG TPA: glycosyltransferase family 9 protein [Chloroflexota bacterium]|nr:glycosyltransferase family 9 protein [Chloroflexota bacterium]
MDPFEPGLLKRIKEPRRIVIVRASRIGDFICATPALRALRAAVPRAQIALLALPMVRELVDRSPYIDRFIAFPGYPGMAEQLFNPRRVTLFFESMQARRFDLAIQMHGSGANSNPFTLMLGAKYTAGFIVPDGDPGRLDAALPMPNVHEIDRNLALMEFLGAPRRGRHTEFPVTLEETARAAALLGNAPHPLIGIHTGARASTKRWFPERFAAAAREIQRLHGGTIVILGEEDSEGSFPSGTRNLTRRTTLGELGGVIRQLSLLITNDSGPAHIAYALGTPTVTIFGGTDPAVWAGIDGEPRRILAHHVPCRPCDYDVCPVGYKCLDGVSVADVVEATGAILAERARRAAQAAAEAAAARAAQPAPTTHR